MGRQSTGPRWPWGARRARQSVIESATAGQRGVKRVNELLSVATRAMKDAPPNVGVAREAVMNAQVLLLDLNQQLHDIHTIMLTVSPDAEGTGVSSTDGDGDEAADGGETHDDLPALQLRLSNT